MNLETKIHNDFRSVFPDAREIVVTFCEENETWCVRVDTEHYFAEVGSDDDCLDFVNSSNSNDTLTVDLDE